MLACAPAVPATASTPAGSARQRAIACATLEAQYQQLEARMRSGYGARQAERLWERRRQLQARRWSLRCQDLPRRAP